jgi:phosphocarrier protein HPr
MTNLNRLEARIGNAVGLHLRAAAHLARLALRFRSEIRVLCNGREANGKSILDLATLAAGCGKRLELQVWGPDADEAIAALATCIESGFYEIA